MTLIMLMSADQLSAQISCICVICVQFYKYLIPMKNKNFATQVLASILLLLSLISYGQKTDKVKTIEIKTSIQCELCEERIMANLPFEKGIKDIHVDIPTKIVTVTYRPDKTDPEKIRLAISEIGYDADDVPADPVAYEKLPECCKKGGHD